MAIKRKAAAAAAGGGGDRRGGKGFIGVRQRPSGRWVAEIKDKVHKIRVWLGTFDTAEKAARAYDEAARLLRGANTRKNFSPSSSSSSSSSSPSSSSSKITNLLLSRLKARNSSSLAAASSSDLNHQQEKLQEEDKDTDDEVADDISDTQLFTDHFLNDPNESCLTHQDHGEEDENSVFLGAFDFQFVDEDQIGSCYFSPFEITEEIVQPDVEQEEVVYDDEGKPTVISEAMKRMNYERKFSATLYAFRGLSECLKLKLKSGSATQSERSCDQLITRMRIACSSRQKEDEKRSETAESSAKKKRNKLRFFQPLMAVLERCLCIGGGATTCKAIAYSRERFKNLSPEKCHLFSIFL